MMKHEESNLSTHGDHYKRPNSVTQNSKLYNILRSWVRARDDVAPCDVVPQHESRRRPHGKPQTDLSNGHGQHSSLQRERPLVVENHGYATLVGRQRMPALAAAAAAAVPELPPRACASAKAAAETKAHEFDLHSAALYANLPAPARMRRMPIVEDATVTAALRRASSAASECSGGDAVGDGDGRAPSEQNKRLWGFDRVGEQQQQQQRRRHHHDGRQLRQSPAGPDEAAERDECASSSSGHNSSTSSADSGGFSRLPPVRLIDYNLANNLVFAKSLDPPASAHEETSRTSASPQERRHQQQQQQQTKKSSSLFIRVGSLVSRAFTPTGGSAGEVSCASSGHFSNDGSTALHTPSNESQSLSVAHFMAAQKPALPPRAREGREARACESVGARGEPPNGGGRRPLVLQAEPPLALAEADLVILPAKQSRGDTQPRKNDTHGGCTLRRAHRANATEPVARECRARREEKRQRVRRSSSRDLTERKTGSRSRPPLAASPPRSTSISGTSSCSSSSLECSSSLSNPCGPASLIDRSHANSDMQLDCGAGRSRHHARLPGEIGSTHGTRASGSLLYASRLRQAHSLQIANEPRRAAGWRKLTEHDDDETSSADEAHAAVRENELTLNGGAKCRSLSLYQNLLRNYVRRRHQHGHHRHRSCSHHKQHSHSDHHHHHHHHHNNHHHHQHRNHDQGQQRQQRNKQQLNCGARRAHCPPTTEAKTATATTTTPTTTTTGRGQRQCPGKNCPSSSEHSSAKSANNKRGPGSALAEQRAGEGASCVWGQLIRINKSDGSQVVELQRAPNRSWGFFVARGAINSMRGIFISRVHDSATGNSLTGLLGIGDRILAIDNCAIEPDDILRVNQMISKKSKIQLRVKPFKG